MFIEAAGDNPVQWIKLDRIIRMRVDAVSGGNSVLIVWIDGDTSSHAIIQAATATVEGVRDDILATFGKLTL